MENHRHVDFRRPSGFGHERHRVEPRLHAATGRGAAARGGFDGQTGPRAERVDVRRDAARPDRPLLRHPDRPLCGARQRAAGLEQPGNRLGCHAGPVGMVSSHGRGRPPGADRRSPGPAPVRGIVAARSSARRADRLHPEPGRRGFDSHAGPPGTVLCRWFARRGTRALRTRPLCAGHRGRGRSDAAGTRITARNAPAEHCAGRHAPDGAGLLGGVGPVRRPGLGQPQQLPGARARRPAVQR